MDKATDFQFGANVETNPFDDDRQPGPQEQADPHRPASDNTRQCFGRLECLACGSFLGYCCDYKALLRELDTLKQLIRDRGIKEKAPMDLKSHRSKNTAGKGGKFTRRPFLKAKDIPAKGLKVKVLDFRTAPESMEYSDFLMDVANGKKEYTVGLRTQSVLLDMIMDELGSKTEKFPGKTLNFVRGGPKGQYVNLG